jgi:hypothetical protein
MADAIMVSRDPEQRKAVLWASERYKVGDLEVRQVSTDGKLAIVPLLSKSECSKAGVLPSNQSEYDPVNNRILISPVSPRTSSHTRGDILSHECLHAYRDHTIPGVRQKFYDPNTEIDEERIIYAIQGNNSALCYGKPYQVALERLVKRFLRHYHTSRIPVGEAPYPQPSPKAFWVFTTYGEPLLSDEDCENRSSILAHHAFYVMVDRYAKGDVARKTKLKNGFTRACSIMADKQYNNPKP